MSIRQQATIGAIAVCLGLLMVVGGSVSKSTAQLKYERDKEKGKPILEEPSTGGATAVMVLGWIAAALGSVLVVVALRGMTRQISEIQSRAESQMRMEASAKQPQKPKT